MRASVSPNKRNNSRKECVSCADDKAKCVRVATTELENGEGSQQDRTQPLAVGGYAIVHLAQKGP